MFCLLVDCVSNKRGKCRFHFNGMLYSFPGACHYRKDRHKIKWYMGLRERETKVKKS
jgi:hypothetical protein